MSKTQTPRGQDYEVFLYGIFDIDSDLNQSQRSFLIQEYNSLSKASALKVNAALRKSAATPV